MISELISVTSLIIMSVVLYCVVKIYSAVMADYEGRQGFPTRFPVQETGPGMGDRGEGIRRFQGERGRLTADRRTENRARPREQDERLC